MANRDPEATKARILAAALREFSAKGISGARVDAIAARAKVNKRMLYYYFGSKEGPVPRDPPPPPPRAVGRAAHAAGVADPDRLAERQRAAASARRQYTRLLMWEALETDPDRPVNEEIRREFFAAWVDAVEEEQRAGTLPADLDAAQLGAQRDLPHAWGRCSCPSSRN